MKALHYVNACAWLANAVVWFAYAGVLTMGAVSLCAAALAVYLARLEQ